MPQGGGAAHLIYRDTVTWRDAAQYRAQAQEVLRRLPDDPLAHYVMAAVAEFGGDMAAVEAHLLRTGLRIGIDYDDYSLRLHRQAEAVYFESRAARQDLKPRFVVSLPKSASAFVTVCFRELCRLPAARVSKGSFATARVIPTWLRTFNRDGGILHDHFPAGPENRERLLQAPPERLVLLLREPVAACLSLCDYVMAEGMFKFYAREVGEVDLSYLLALEPAAARSALFQKLFPRIADWIEGWMAFARQEHSATRFAVLKFEDAVADMPAALDRLACFFDGRAGLCDARDPAWRNRVDALFADYRSRERTTATVHLGRRATALGDAEQEVVWRVWQGAYPELRGLYDLSGHLR